MGGSLSIYSRLFLSLFPSIFLVCLFLSLSIKKYIYIYIICLPLAFFKDWILRVVSLFVIICLQTLHLFSCWQSLLLSCYVDAQMFENPPKGQMSCVSDWSFLNLFGVSLGCKLCNKLWFFFIRNTDTACMRHVLETQNFFKIFALIGSFSLWFHLLITYIYNYLYVLVLGLQTSTSLLLRVLLVVSLCWKHIILHT